MSVKHHPNCATQSASEPENPCDCPARSELPATAGSADTLEFSPASKWVMARAVKLATEIDNGKLQVCHIQEAIGDFEARAWNELSPPNND